MIYDLSWTRFSNMNVLPDQESHSPWSPGGSFEIWQATDGILTIKTTGSNTGVLGRGEWRLDNGVGTTVEVRMKLLEASSGGFQGACISLQDGKREAKLSFYPDRIVLRDQNNEKASYEMDTTDGFHTYRLAMVRDSCRAYVDGEEIAGIALDYKIEAKAIILGDISKEEDENIYAELDYLAYHVEGAMSPDELSITTTDGPSR